jgi:predicted nucleic acid-binding protein
MRIILDTGTFYHPNAIQELASTDAPIIVPAVAYAERLRQLRKAGQSVPHFEHVLDAGGYTVEPFGRPEALRMQSLMLNAEQWRRSSRDALIAAHVGPEDQLWTTNPRDFERMGLPGSRIRTIGTPEAAVS